MFGVDVYGVEDFGRPLFEDGTATKRAFLSGGAENRKAKVCETARETQDRLFEDIGRYFCVSAQDEQMETQNTSSGLERPEESFADFPLARRGSAALYAENIRTYTARGGFQFSADTESSEPF